MGLFGICLKPEATCDKNNEFFLESFLHIKNDTKSEVIHYIANLILSEFSKQKSVYLTEITKKREKALVILQSIKKYIEKDLEDYALEGLIDVLELVVECDYLFASHLLDRDENIKKSLKKITPKTETADNSVILKKAKNLELNHQNCKKKLSLINELIKNWPDNQAFINRARHLERLSDEIEQKISKYQEKCSSINSNPSHTNSELSPQYMSTLLEKTYRILDEHIDFYHNKTSDSKKMIDDYESQLRDLLKKRSSESHSSRSSFDKIIEEIIAKRKLEKSAINTNIEFQKSLYDIRNIISILSNFQDTKDLDHMLKEAYNKLGSETLFFIEYQSHIHPPTTVKKFCCDIEDNYHELTRNRTQGYIVSSDKNDNENYNTLFLQALAPALLPGNADLTQSDKPTTQNISESQSIDHYVDEHKYDALMLELGISTNE